MESNWKYIFSYQYQSYDFSIIFSCADYLKINDNLPQCSYDQPRLVYSTKNDALNISFKSLPTGASVNELRGFKLYFEGFMLRLGIYILTFVMFLSF